MTAVPVSAPASLIQKQKTIALTTADPGPWCAPVCYVHRTLPG
jgi:hypothetical protein